MAIHFRHPIREAEVRKLIEFSRQRADVLASRAAVSGQRRTNKRTNRTEVTARITDLLRSPERPRKLTARSVRAYKAQLRRYDAVRVARQLASPMEINRENSIFGHPTSIRVIRFPSF